MQQLANRETQVGSTPNRVGRPRRRAAEIGPYAGLGLADASSYHLLGAAFSARRREVALTRHQVAHIIGVDPKTAARRLARFEAVGLAERVTVGSRGRGLAGEWLLRLRVELTLKKGTLPFSVESNKPSIIPARSSSRSFASLALPEWKAVLEALKAIGKPSLAASRKLLSTGLTAEETLLTIRGAAAEAAEARNPMGWIIAILTTGDLGARFRRPSAPAIGATPVPAQAAPLEQAGASRPRIARAMPELQRLYGAALGEAIAAALRLVDTRPNVQARGAYACHLLQRAPERIFRALNFADGSNKRRDMEALEQKASTARALQLNQQQRSGLLARPAATRGEGARLWQELRNALAARVTAPAFKEWIDPSIPVFFDGAALHLSVPTRSACNWIQEQFTEEIHEALAEAGHPALQILWRAEWGV